jgi:hypothetical protein
LDEAKDVLNIVFIPLLLSNNCHWSKTVDCSNNWLWVSGHFIGDDFTSSHSYGSSIQKSLS